MPDQPTASDEIDRLVNFDQVKLILTIVEARSFSGAAAALGVSQPSISQHVQRIERSAGRTLFRRSNSGIALTSDGEAVVVYARAMLELTDDLRRHFRETARPMCIRVGMAEDFCRSALPSVLWLFMREFPKVEICIVSGTYEMLVTAIAARTVDFAVVRRFPFPSRTTSFLWSDRLVWIARKDLEVPVNDPVPLILPVAPNPTRETMFEALRAHRRTWRPAAEISSYAGAEAAIGAGLGLIAGPATMPWPSHIGALDESSGLPPLPDVDFVIVDPDPAAPDTVRVLADLLRRAAAGGFTLPK